MTTITLIRADLALQKQVLIDLNLDYMDWVVKHVEQHFGLSTQALLGMTLAEYVPDALEKICGKDNPDSRFYLFQVDGQFAAMGGMRSLPAGAGKIAEIKRLYVLPAYRGLHLGEQLLQALLTDARTLGYQTACLDSAPFMHAAHRLYEAAGFKDCPAYEGAEVPAALHAGWRFMEMSL
ncbi:GNAT family N-acetyltransferase [Undibacterium sp. Di27W]|uniref:GNAT family N-acetyltransferase n=1 Tax=Undibacterium sp. Di27W TaxID=3413036 RepID=UPI003BF0DE7B